MNGDEEYEVDHELKYLEQEEFEKNEFGVFIYVSKNGNHIISIDAILEEYKNYLINNKILKSNES